MSTRLTAVLDEPYLRFCVPCDAIHTYEQPFRLAALRAGLELQPGTSPPVLRPIPGFAPGRRRARSASTSSGRTCACSGPATPKLVAGYLDAPVKDVQARWPEDAVEVDVDGERRWLLAEDADRLGDTARAGRGCSARSTSTCRPATGRCWSTTRPARRTCGAPSAARAASCPTARSSAPGGRARPARRWASRSTCGTAPAPRPPRRSASRRSGSPRSAGCASRQSDIARADRGATMRRDRSGTPRRAARLGRRARRRPGAAAPGRR